MFQSECLCERKYSVNIPPNSAPPAEIRMDKNKLWTENYFHYLTPVNILAGFLGFLEFLDVGKKTALGSKKLPKKKSQNLDIFLFPSSNRGKFSLILSILHNGGNKKNKFVVNI